MSDRSTSLDLPYIQPTQSQKHVTHNEAIELLDLLVQLSVQEFDAEVPPVAPQEGQTWALGASPTGDWSGADGQLASYRGGGWLFLQPKDGWRAWGLVDGAFRTYAGGVWVNGSADFENVPGLGINSTSDATNRLSVSSDASLLNHDGGGHQIKINKANQTETASLLFQSDWSGRAEIGLAGEDDLSLKASADGTNWFTAMSIKGTDGSVGIKTLLNVKPGLTPAAPITGDIYFDSTLMTLRCFDGTSWQDLF